jgi:hypothetical protein
MRDYGKVSPLFWTGKTGKALRKEPEALIAALYLMTSPHSNMIGIYTLPILYMAHETGMTIKGASEALRRLAELDFCTYDHDAEIVFVHEMAKYQIAEQLSPADKQVIGVRNELAKVSVHSMATAFFDRYKEAFHLTETKGDARPSKPPTKPRAGTGAGTGPRKDSVPDGTGSVEPVDEIFASGLPLLIQAGMKDQSARSMLGMLRKHNGDVKVVNAIRQCIVEKPIQPISWLQAALAQKAMAKVNVKHEGGQIVEPA